MPQKPSPELFFDTMNAYQRSAALKAAVELGIFTAIGGGRPTSAEIATACGVAPRGARILCDYLVTLGFITKQDNRYVLTADSALFLDARSPAYIGAAVEFLDSEHHRANFAALADRVRAGGAPATDDGALAPEHEIWVKFARGMGGLQAMPARLLATFILGSQPARPMRILDLAAGHGMFGIAFLQQNPQARVVGQDWANVLEVARENAAKSSVLERYELLPGSAFDVNLASGDPYDIVLLPNLMHHFDQPANTILLKRIHGALKPGGQVVIVEFIPDEDRTTPEDAVRFALVMLANTPGGDAYTFSELRAMCQSAGFANASLHDLPPALSRVVIATK